MRLVSFPHRALTALGALALLLHTSPGNLRAQDDPTAGSDKVDQFEQLLLSARQAIGFDRPDQALLALLQAQSRLTDLWGDPDGDPVLNESRRQDLVDLLRKVDPHEEARMAVETEIAEATVGLTRDYLRKRRPETALHWIHRVAPLDPKATAKQERSIQKRVERDRKKRLAALAKEAEKAEASRPKKKSKPLLESVRFDEQIGSWTLKDGVLITPTAEELGGKYAYFRTFSSTHGDGRISSLVDMGKKPASVAFAFGVTMEDSFVVELHSSFVGNQQYFEIHVGTSGGTDYTRMSSGDLRLPINRPRQAIRWGIEIEGTTIRSVLEDQVVATTEASRKPYGTYGFLVPSYSKHEGRMTLRELRIDLVGTRVDPEPSGTANAEAEDSASLAAAMQKRIEKAKAWIDEDRADEATVALLHLERELLDLEDVQFATELREVRVLLDGCDPCRKDVSEHRSEVAAKLLTLVDLYEKDRPLGSLAYLRQAALLDPDLAEARYLKTRRSLEPSLMAAFGLPPEPEAEVLAGAMKPFVVDATYPGVGGNWDDGVDVLTVRPHNNRVAMAIRTDRLPRSGRMRVQVLAESAAMFGFVTRYGSVDDVEMLWIRDRARTTELILSRWSQGQWDEPIRQQLRFESAARKTWRTLELEWTPASARARLGLGPWMDLPAGRFNHAQSFGLCASATSEGAEARFRNFELSED